uniref:Protein valois n=1 Tax=Lygus hesperus TaxID=30085 RepID=A0A0A9X739_LYGHE
MVRFIAISILVVAAASVAAAIDSWHEVPYEECVRALSDPPRKPLCKCWQSVTPNDKLHGQSSTTKRQILKWFCAGRDPNFRMSVAKPLQHHVESSLSPKSSTMVHVNTVKNRGR